MQRIVGTIFGKASVKVAQFKGGSGQALPGLLVEKLLPGYLSAMLRQLSEGVTIVTGTNGKTTTTKMIVELLTANGKKVLTNPSGSNMTRGINSALIHQAHLNGRLLFDLAVLELDEAYARQFVRAVKPRWVVALNVTRDQLDRFGEVDSAASMIIETMRAATVGIVTNADDTRLLQAAHALRPKELAVFGVSNDLRQFFPSDSELVAVEKKPMAESEALQEVQLVHFDGQKVTYKLAGKQYTASLQLNGQHNFQNAAAALALVRRLLPKVSDASLVSQLSTVQPAFGRGQLFALQNGGSVRLVLVKNPSGFRQALASYLPTTEPIMIAINDNIADGRDVSWLWDVDFASLQKSIIACTTGKRAADMALRLQYDTCRVEVVEPDLAKALGAFCALPGDKLLFATYTAMTWLHKTLEQQAGKTL